MIGLITQLYSIHLVDLQIPSGMAISRLPDYYRLPISPSHQVWCAVDDGGYNEGYHYNYDCNSSVYTLCYDDWDNDGENEYWHSVYFSAYVELDWGFDSYANLPTWIGGDGVSELPLYVQGLYPGIQYRLILYFELVSIVNFVE